MGQLNLPERSSTLISGFWITLFNKKIKLFTICVIKSAENKSVLYSKKPDNLPGLTRMDSNRAKSITPRLIDIYLDLKFGIDNGCELS
jgi:hypothetical protein